MAREGKNRKCEIYYYAVHTTSDPDLSRVLEENVPNNELNKVIVPNMIEAILEYFNK